MNFQRNFLLLFSTFLLTLPGALAQGLDQASMKALQQTQELLTTPALREKAVSENAGSKEAHRNLQSLFGSDPEATQEAYRLAADLMESLTYTAGGDSLKMLELLEQAKKNPEGFARNFSPEQRSALKALADKAPAAK